MPPWKSSIPLVLPPLHHILYLINCNPGHTITSGWINPRNGTRYRHSFNGILTRTCTCRTQGCHFEWPWVTLSGLAKYSMTRSIARPLCDSWASYGLKQRCSPITFLFHVIRLQLLWLYYIVQLCGMLEASHWPFCYFQLNLGGRLSAPLWLCWCDGYSVTSVYSSFRSHTAAAVASRDGSIPASPASLGIAVVDSYDFKELRTAVIEFRFTWFVSFFSRRSFHMYEDHTYFIPCDSKSASLEVCGIGMYRINRQIGLLQLVVARIALRLTYSTCSYSLFTWCAALKYRCRTTIRYGMKLRQCAWLLACAACEVERRRDGMKLTAKYRSKTTAEHVDIREDVKVHGAMHSRWMDYCNAFHRRDG